MRGEDSMKTRSPRKSAGSPPHARGRRQHQQIRRSLHRITPACAGKTRNADLMPRAGGDHPRMRGEDGGKPILPVIMAGSPPHARGRLADPASWDGVDEDHPRMRGEDHARRRIRVPGVGSPPHARGRLHLNSRRIVVQGITPACAGKTRPQPCQVCEFRDHPRMRGEDHIIFNAVNQQTGSPPHARGRLPHPMNHQANQGITPACAGKTSEWKTMMSGRPDHPRMRGEDAGNAPQTPHRRDHPRMRGEDGLTAWPGVRVGGSPPHARGRRRVERPASHRRRITPACAGKTRRAVE